MYLIDDDIKLNLVSIINFRFIHKIYETISKILQTKNKFRFVYLSISNKIYIILKIASM